MKGVLYGSVRHIYGRISHRHCHMLANNRLETS
jgi:hypothetical protein